MAEWPTMVAELGEQPFRAGQLAVRDNLRSQMATWRVEKEAQQTAEATSVITPIITPIITPVTPLTVVGKDVKIVQMRRRIFQYASAAVLLLAVGFAARWGNATTRLVGH